MRPHPGERQPLQAKLARERSGLRRVGVLLKARPIRCYSPPVGRLHSGVLELPWASPEERPALQEIIRAETAGLAN
jgi:hypothetical protein